MRGMPLTALLFISLSNIVSAQHSYSCSHHCPFHPTAAAAGLFSLHFCEMLPFIHACESARTAGQAQGR